MNRSLKEYFLAITSICLLYSLAITITPRGAIRKITDLIGGLLVILVTLSPLLQLDINALVKGISQYSLKTDYLQEDIEIGSRELMCRVIRQKCETYILDKAENMGIQLSVEVTLDQSADVPYPNSVSLVGNWTVEQQKTLSRYIAGNLGIPEDRQEWIWM